MDHARLQRLRDRHRELEQQLRTELKRPEPDNLAIQDLKRRKLQIKDDIFLARAGLEPVQLQAG
jgi:hypothetical protein